MVTIECLTDRLFFFFPRRCVPGGQGLLPDFQLPAPSGPAGRAAHTGWPMKELLVFHMEWEKSEASV